MALSRRLKVLVAHASTIVTAGIYGQGGVAAVHPAGDFSFLSNELKVALLGADERGTQLGQQRFS